MPYTNSTANYGLPQYIATDKPTYLGDANSAYSTIDTQMKANANASAANNNALSLLSARVLANEGNISDNTDNIASLNTAIEGWVGSQIVPATAFSTSPAINFKGNKKLGVISIDAYLTKGSVGIVAGETLFVLPEGFRPYTTIYIRGGCLAAGTSTSGWTTLSISASGIVSVGSIVTRFGDGIVRDLYLDLDINTAGWGTGFPPISQI